MGSLWGRIFRFTCKAMGHVRFDVGTYAFCANCGLLGVVR